MSANIQLQNQHEAELLLKGLDALGKKDAVADNLRRRLKVALRYFKNLETTNSALKSAALKRDVQRRRDGRG